MAQRVSLASELEAMTPAEQDALFDGSVVTDLDSVPPQFLQRVRERLEHRIAGAGNAGPQ